MMKADRVVDEMKCPKCGRFDLRESEDGVRCKVCGYSLSPGEVDKFRLFRLLREESRKRPR
jgi:rubredoxin